MQRFHIWLVSLLVSGLWLALTMDRTSAASDAWEAARQPGAVLIMRHALAPGGGDPAGFSVGDCSTQRNLNDKGRDQAQMIGEALRQNRVKIDRVVSSQWCRCLETAELLGFGPVEEVPALNSFFQRHANREPQTLATKAFLADLPAGERVMLVTHQVNISALTGQYPASGEIFVLQVKDGGSVTVTGRIAIDP